MSFVLKRLSECSGVGTADTVHGLCYDCAALITLIWEVFNMGGLHTLPFVQQDSNHAENNLMFWLMTVQYFCLIKRGAIS